MGERDSGAAPPTAVVATGQIQRGFSLLEFCVVTVVVSVVLGVFFERVLLYQELAEKTAAEVTVMNMRTGLRYRVAELLLHRQEREVADLIGSNPVKWLDLPLSNYAGEFSAAQLEKVPPGSWYFDLSKGEIHYRIKRQRHFAPGPSGRPELRFRITASLRKAGTDGSVLLAEGVNLALLEPYKWFYNSERDVLP